MTLVRIRTAIGTNHRIRGRSVGRRAIGSGSGCGRSRRAVRELMLSDTEPRPHFAAGAEHSGGSREAGQAPDLVHGLADHAQALVVGRKVVQLLLERLGRYRAIISD